MGGKRIVTRTHAKRKAVAMNVDKGSLHRDTATGRFVRADVAKHGGEQQMAVLGLGKAKTGVFTSVKYGRAGGPAVVKATMTDGSTFETRSSRLVRAAVDRKRSVSGAVEQVVARASQILGSTEAARAWLAKPSRWLDDRSPLDLIRAGERAEVDRYLGQIEYGVYV